MPVEICRAQRGVVFLAALVIASAGQRAAAECPPPPELLVDPAATNEDGLGDCVALRLGEDSFVLLGNPNDDFVGTNSGSLVSSSWPHLFKVGRVRADSAPSGCGSQPAPIRAGQATWPDDSIRVLVTPAVGPLAGARGSVAGCGFGQP